MVFLARLFVGMGKAGGLFIILFVLFGDTIKNLPINLVIALFFGCFVVMYPADGID